MHTRIFSKHQQSVFERLEKLKGFFEKHQIILFGGTALALQIGHRMSYDFDFLSSEPALRDHFLQEIKTILPKLQISQWEENTVSVHWNEVQISFFSNITLPILKPRIHYQHLKMLDKPDLVAMKIAAMLRRATIRDYFDIAYLLQFENISLHHMIEWFQEKYAEQQGHFSKSLLLKTLNYIDDIPEEDLKILTQQKFWGTKKKLKRTIGRVIQEKTRLLLDTYSKHQNPRPSTIDQQL